MISSKCNQAHLFVNVSRCRMKSFTDAKRWFAASEVVQQTFTFVWRESVCCPWRGWNGRIKVGEWKAGTRWGETDTFFDLQMRLTRRVPSVSSPRCQAKISGSTPEAERKSRVRREEESKCGGKSLGRAGALRNKKKANKPFKYFKGIYFIDKELIYKHVLLPLWTHPPLDAPD